jgi:hypothetical protein
MKTLGGQESDFALLLAGFLNHVSLELRPSCWYLGHLVQQSPGLIKLTVVTWT